MHSSCPQERWLSPAPWRSYLERNREIAVTPEAGSAEQTQSLFSGRGRGGVGQKLPRTHSEPQGKCLCPPELKGSAELDLNGAGPWRGMCCWRGFRQALWNCRALRRVYAGTCGVEKKGAQIKSISFSSTCSGEAVALKVSPPTAALYILRSVIERPPKGKVCYCSLGLLTVLEMVPLWFAHIWIARGRAVWSSWM